MGIDCTDSTNLVAIYVTTREYVTKNVIKFDENQMTDSIVALNHKLIRNFLHNQTFLNKNKNIYT